MTIKHLLIGLGVLVIIIALVIIYRRVPQKLNQKKIEAQWKKIQSYCREKANWPKALEESDKLLNRCLKKRRFKGKSMGEKMVSAQRLLSDNDGLWYAHNLYKKLRDNQTKKLRESDLKVALVAYRQALRDLGGLSNNDGKK